MSNIKLFNPNEDLSAKQKLEIFAQEYATNGGKHKAAYIEAGFSAETASQNALRYLNKNHDYVMSVFHRVATQTAAQVQLELLNMLQKKDITDANKLKVISELNKTAGVHKDRMVIEEKSASDLTPEQRKQEMAELLKKVNNG